MKWCMSLTSNIVWWPSYSGGPHKWHRQWPLTLCNPAGPAKWLCPKPQQIRDSNNTFSWEPMSIQPKVGSRKGAGKKWDWRGTDHIKCWTAYTYIRLIMRKQILDFKIDVYFLTNVKLGCLSISHQRKLITCEMKYLRMAFGRGDRMWQNNRKLTKKNIMNCETINKVVCT